MPVQVVGYIRFSLSWSDDRHSCLIVVAAQDTLAFEIGAVCPIDGSDVVTPFCAFISALYIGWTGRIAREVSFSETGIIITTQYVNRIVMKPRTQILVTVIAIVVALFVWWMTIQERSTLLGDPNKRTDSTKVNYSEECIPWINNTYCVHDIRIA